MANYSREKGKYGGMVGTIQPFCSYLPLQNDPGSAEFKDLIPAGFLRCDGSIQAAVNYPELASILGTGEQSRFKKPNVTLTDNQFQLPDLGSKYIRPGVSTGSYLDYSLQDDENKRKVGSEFTITSNVGNSASVGYNGNFRVTARSAASSGLSLLGNPKMIPPTNRATDSVALSDVNFQAHGHLANQTVLNYTGRHLTASGGKSGNDATPYGGNELLPLSPPDGTSSSSSTHTHRIDMPGSFPHNFKYGWAQIDAPVDSLTTTVNLSLKNVKTLDNVIAPFILVEYIIKY